MCFVLQFMLREVRDNHTQLPSPAPAEFLKASLSETSIPWALEGLGSCGLYLSFLQLYS
jgi:hypothetical protein